MGQGGLILIEHAYENEKAKDSQLTSYTTEVMRWWGCFRIQGKEMGKVHITTLEQSTTTRIPQCLMAINHKPQVTLTTQALQLDIL